MFGWAGKQGTFRQVVEFSGARNGTAAQPEFGFVAGTKVATPKGWTEVQSVGEGDMVLTFDGGMQEVKRVHRTAIFPAMDRSQWPLAVPAGALGNREQMILLPHQTVLIESDAAEETLGDPFSLMAASALEGFRGIGPIAPDHRIEVIQLEFARDEIVFAKIGALFLCPKATDLVQTDGDDAAIFPYQILSDDQADMLIALIEMDEAPRPHSTDAAEAMRSVA